LKVASKKEYLIYDSFMGSGTTAAVCKKHNIDFIGSELNIKNYEKAVKRINNINLLF
jgi:site-specific DNA-methyltransferase (adenine-specific)